MHPAIGTIRSSKFEGDNNSTIVDTSDNNNDNINIQATVTVIKTSQVAKI